jgi:hypothetical protein
LISTGNSLLIFLLFIVPRSFSLLVILSSLYFGEMGQLFFEIINEFFVLSATLFDLLEVIVIDSKVIKDYRFDACVVLLHNVFVLQLPLDLRETLHVGVDDFAVLLAIAQRHRFVPLHGVEFEIEVQNKKRMSHINESETHIEPCFEVHGQVEEVVPPSEVPVQQLEHIVLHELDGDVLDHQSGQLLRLCIRVLFGSKNSVEVDLVALRPSQVLPRFLLLLLLVSFGGLVDLLHEELACIG